MGEIWGDVGLRLERLGRYGGDMGEIYLLALCEYAVVLPRLHVVLVLERSALRLLRLELG